MSAVLAGRASESWIAEYGQSHQRPLNRLTPTLGIRMILVSLLLLPVGSRWWAVKVRGKA